MSTELEVQPQAITLFGSSEPNAVVYAATEHATALADVLKKKHLYKTISGRNFVLVEGWTLLGSMLGVFPICVWTRHIGPDEETGQGGGWEARVEARTRAGEVVGAAEAECLYSETNWSKRDDYALRSMAQTRAVSKALRLPLGFIVALAGYEVTSAEEMPSEEAKGES